jgi:hypothetical protein
MHIPLFAQGIRGVFGPSFLKEQPYCPVGTEPVLVVVAAGLQQTPPRQSVAPEIAIVPASQLELVGDPQFPPRLLQLAAKIFGEKKEKDTKKKISGNNK